MPLAIAAQNNASLKHFDLSDNLTRNASPSLLGDTMRQIGLILEKNSSILSLALTKLYIDDHIVSNLLAPAIVANHTIVSLDLSKHAFV
jgi:hypothetical protein